jgi:tRNA threonylcarbamoyl adenosine modification protein (Sua5/YciO/YrdC/YwlC family)
VVLYPTDTVYAIGCDLNSKSAVERVRHIKRLANEKPLTFICLSLSDAAQYCKIEDPAYRLMRRLIPGPYTFVLPATKLVPRVVMDPKRKTTGIRIPRNPICQAILENLGNPVISTSAHLPEPGDFALETDLPPAEPTGEAELFDRLDGLVDGIVTVDDRESLILGGEADYQVSTILDLTGHDPIVVRRGLGWAAVEQTGMIHSK